ncbi:condensin subunit Smc [Ferrimonas sediminum]|uniref:Chromosome partition protein Smc n=1 Tax=Ferrimonas sediminum TaxID=718193 RepID=A0A1G8TZW0_9GAMM|nr:chromosome segregation protein SMC [Ferrimonas sediminum]SDJ47041.1 condensin subunit Smc [Ferrimonas sediminum]
MRLKQIKLAGFKSFADPTRVPFPSQMTAIVGPNGCGKSNVIDAVRWVLGESSAKNLRGDAMTDVIFNGSGSRPASSLASVELVFDNEQGRLGGQFATFKEVAIKRQVNRDAQSSYFLNGNKCRRRDITDIFMGTGLGPRSYAIIEQGMISRLIESRPQELRVFIEEAAGISKYKERRRETENRIKHTRENLERLADVRIELGQQLERLQRQADAARRYRNHKANEHTLQNQLLALRWRDVSDRMTALEAQLAQKQTEHRQCQEAQQGDLSALMTLEQSQSDLKARLDQQQQGLFRISSDVTRLEQQILHGKQRHQQLQQERDRTVEQLAGDAQQRARLSAERDDLDQQSEQLEPELEMATEALQALQEQLESRQEQALVQQQQQQQQQHKVSELTRQHDVIAERRLALGREQTQLQQQQARIQDRMPAGDGELERQLQQASEQLEQLTLEQAQAEEDKRQRQQWLAECEQSVLQGREQLLALQQQLGERRARRQGIETLLGGLKQSLPVPFDGLPRLWQQLEIDSHWQGALELVLSSLLQAVVIGDDGDLADIPAAVTALQPNDAKVPESKDSLLAKVASPLNLSPWLARVHCADSLAEARQRLAQLDSDHSVVTPDGTWLGHGFCRRAGDSQPSVLNLAEELQALTQLETDADQQRQQQQRLLTDTEQQHSQAKQQLADTEQRWRQGQTELVQAQMRRQQLTHQCEHQQQQRQQAQEQLMELQDTAETLVEQSLDLEQQQALVAEQLHEQRTQSERDQEGWSRAAAEVSQLRQQLQQRQQQLQQMTLAQQTLMTRRQGVEAQLAQQQDNAGIWQSRLEEAEEAKQALLEPLGEWQMALEQGLEQRHEQEQQIAAVNEQLAEVEQRLASINDANRGQIERLTALAETITELKMEHEGLRVQAQGQLDLLAEAEVSLQQVLHQLPADAAVDQCQEQLARVRERIKRLGAINLAAIEEFEQQSQRKTYLDEQDKDLTEALETLETAIRKIDRETRQRFKATFDEVNGGLGELFPKVFGGGSAYLALTDDDLLETGVTIMARPPGKKNATIHLLSGGEKALTALSLVFAIFRLNPAPFCMLDEVDAPLDDANVGRFCRLVKEMSETVQFIYISHNKVSMEMADQLTGVTMHEPGASRIVAVNVEEAAAMAQL